MSQQTVVSMIRRALFTGVGGLMFYAAAGLAQPTMQGPGNGQMGPPPLPESCIADPASCRLSAEEVAGIQACQADRESEACEAFREAHEEQEQNRQQARTLPENCVSDPASCGMTAEEVAGVQACQADRESEECQAFRATKGKPEACQTAPNSEDCLKQVGKRPLPDCVANPGRCRNPGPALFDMDTQTLYVHTIRVRQDGEVGTEVYTLELHLSGDANTFTLTKVERVPQAEDQAAE
jgi:hypothetical protein